jgi:hypothetical protein
MDEYLAKVLESARTAPSFEEARVIMALAAESCLEGDTFTHQSYKQTFLFDFPEYRIYLDLRHDGSHSIMPFRK